MEHQLVYKTFKIIHPVHAFLNKINRYDTEKCWDIMIPQESASH